MAGLPKIKGPKRDNLDPMKKILEDIKKRREEQFKNREAAAAPVANAPQVVETTPAPAVESTPVVEETPAAPVVEAPAQVAVAEPAPAPVQENYNDFSYDDDLDINNI
jgi:hypothetical protein